jgi:hypothetical protein
MLDGRIDMQGTVKELREQNLLYSVVHETQEAESSTSIVASAEEAAATALPAEGGVTSGAKAEPKKAKKLVKEEARATGNVKWPIYKTYLEAW